MWANGAKEESLNFLRQFSASLARDVMQETNAQTQRPGVSKSKMAELSKLVARCYYKQGEWQVALKDDWSSVRLFLIIDVCPLNQPFFQRNVEDILHAYYLATHYDPGWYKAWHTWALANFSVIAYMESPADGKPNDVAGERLAAHIVQAVKGWFRPITSSIFLLMLFAQAFFDRSLFAIRMLSRISFVYLHSGLNSVNMMKSVSPWGAGFQL